MHRSTTSKGKYGEDFAIKYLRKRGHTLIERNFKSKFAEIDLITLKVKTIYFLEVKYSSRDLIPIDQRITPGKVMKIKSLAAYWLSINKKFGNFETRMAYVEIVENNSPKAVNFVIIGV